MPQKARKNQSGKRSLVIGTKNSEKKSIKKVQAPLQPLEKKIERKTKRKRKEDGESTEKEGLRAVVFQGRHPPQPLDDVKEFLTERISEIEKWCRAAVSKYSADIIVFPELFLQGYEPGTKFLKESALIAGEGPHFKRLLDLAQELSLYIAIPYCEVAQNTYYNSVSLLGTDGKLLGNYRKTHLFGNYEKAIFGVGDKDQYKLYDIKVPRLSQTFKAGMLICMDIEYPESARVYGVMGANLLIVPTAMACGPCEWLTPSQIVPTRALENHVFLLYSNFVSNAPTTLPQQTNPKENKDSTYQSTTTLQLSGHCIVSGDDVACPPLIYCGRSGIIGPDGQDLIRAPGLSLYTNTPSSPSLLASSPSSSKSTEEDDNDVQLTGAKKKKKKTPKKNKNTNSSSSSSNSNEDSGDLYFSILNVNDYIKDVIRNPYLYERRPELYSILVENNKPVPGIQLPETTNN